MFSSARVAAPANSRNGDRRLVLVDIENVVGGAVESPTSVAWARERLAELVAIGSDDLVVVGTCHRGLLAVGCAWTGVRYVVGSGPDGADLALLEVLGERVAQRFAEVVVVSGDGIFSEAVSALGREGVRVVVVAHPDGLSRRLAMAAAESRFLRERWTAPFGDFGGAA